MKNQKGITLISLVITIIVMAIISSAMIFNSRNHITIKDINDLYADIQNLNRKVDEYYIKYGELPVICDFRTEYVDNSYDNNRNNLRDYLNRISGRYNISFSEDATIVNPNDGNEYYVIDLNKLDGINLNFGCYDEYKQVKNNGKTTIYEEQAETDIYIINGLTHQIYYLAGVVSGKTMYNSYDLDTTAVNVNEPAEKTP